MWLVHELEQKKLSVQKYWFMSEITSAVVRFTIFLCKVWEPKNTIHLLQLKHQKIEW